MEDNNYADFISTVSHELRTPLTSIHGFSQTILTSWDKLDDENKKKFIKIIEEQSQRLIHLVENMLSVSKLQQNKCNCVFSDVEVNPVIEQVTSIIKAQYSSQNFVLNLAHNLPELYLDKDRFQQVMMNLIENSAKYSIMSNQTNIKSKVLANKVVISVSNIGIHLSEEEKEKIFSKFSRIDNPLTRKVQGSGLGLYITKNLVLSMNGNIKVVSTPLKDKPEYGSIEFILEFPIYNLEDKARIKCKL